MSDARWSAAESWGYRLLRRAAGSRAGRRLAGVTSVNRAYHALLERHGFGVEALDSSEIGGVVNLLCRKRVVAGLGADGIP